MNVRDILERVEYIDTVGRNAEVEVKGLTRDSRTVEEGYLYFAVIGEVMDGHSFIESAINAGAKIIVHSKEIDFYNEDIFYIKVEDVRKAMADISKIYFECPGDIKIIGVTGTNGKTTTTSIIKNVLESMGNKVGLIGTIANYIGDKRIETERTTPESIELYSLINRMKNEGCNYCVMEVSSHASAMDRIRGIDFVTGVFTNLTQDHLDFHKTFEEYYDAKFNFIKNTQYPVINADDEYGKRMIGFMKNNSINHISYGIDSGDVRAVNIKQSSSGSTFDLIINGVEKGNVNINIPGLYNVYNVLGVITSLSEVVNIPVESIVEALSRGVFVEGRCEKVSCDGLNATVVVDYAHTPDGLDNILKTMRPITKGNLITIFGCGGNRDAEKRPLMGQVASNYSDLVVVTSDNPRHEEPRKIILDIMKGVNGTSIILENRKCAIEYAIAIAKKDDTVVIAGKGHEDYQIIGDTKYKFSDKEVVENYFKNRI